jgi:hypothetical protein
MRQAVRALRRPLRILVFAAFGLSAGFAGEVPSPLFYESESEFLQDVDNGQFDQHLELHLLEYSVDSRWTADWADRRYSSSGLLGAYGSISSQQLFVDSDVALNLFPHERFQLRYEWKAYQEKRFDVSEQRLDALWYASSGWGIVFTCWPAYQKEEIAGGLGFKIGKPKSTKYLVVRAVDERLIWNEKTESGVRFTGAPVRIVADGNFDGGRYRVSGSVDYGLAYEAVDEEPGGDVADRAVRGHQRFADVAVERSSEGWAAGVRLTLGSLARRQEEASGTVFDLDRVYGRVILNGRREMKGWTALGLAGVARQRDDSSSPEYPASAYTMNAFLIGAEGSKRFGKGLDLRAGYLGNFWSGERTGAGDGLLSAREEDTYADKVHLRALYTFRPQMAFECLLSQTLSGSRFGGASLKALLVF